MIVIREQKSHILSAYKYFLLFGGVCNIKRFLYQEHALWMPSFKVDYFKYNYIIKFYKELYGNDHIHVVLLEQIIRKEKEALRELAKFCGANPDNERFNEINYFSAEQKSKSSLSLAARMYLNPLIGREAVNGYSYLSSGVFTKITWPFLKILETCSPKFIETWINQGWRDRIGKVTQGKFAESNRELSEILEIDLEIYGYES